MSELHIRLKLNEGTVALMQDDGVAVPLKHVHSVHIDENGHAKVTMWSTAVDAQVFISEQVATAISVMEGRRVLAGLLDDLDIATLRTWRASLDPGVDLRMAAVIDKVIAAATNPARMM